MKKRMLALLLTLCLVVSLLPAQMVVAEGTATDLTLDANLVGTFTPSTSGTYVFYDTTSQNENSAEWDISVQYANGEGENTYTDVAVAVNDTYETRGYRAELTAGTTYTVVANNNANRTLSLKVAPAAYGGEISFSKNAEEASGAVVGGEWGLDVVPVAPNGVLGQIDWSAVVSDTDDTPTDCVDMTANDNRVTLNFIKEGTFLLKATSGDKACSMEIAVGPAEGSDAGNSSDAVDLGAFPVGVPTVVEVPRGDDPSTGLPLPGKAVATFTPSNTNIYTIYRSVPSNGVYNGQQIQIFLDGETVDWHSSWYNADKNMSGKRWELTAGKEYRIEFQGHTVDEGGITYTLKETVTPDSIYFPYETYTGYAEMGSVDAVSFQPVHGYAPVTYSVADTSVAEVASWGDVVFKQVGQTKVTATCGALTASADVVVKPYETLELDKELKVSTGVSNYWIICRFQPAKTGDYTFNVSGLGSRSVNLSDVNEDFSEHWFMEEGDESSHTVALEKDEEYILRISTDYTRTEYTVSVTDGGNQGGNGSLLVILDGYHGDEDYGGGTFHVPGDGGVPYDVRYRVWEWASAGQTVSQVTGLTSLADPTWDEFTFEGWLLYREDGDPFNGPRELTLESRNPISTADMLASTVPGYNISYIAKWAEIDWEYYENIYDPYYGVGNEGSEYDQNIHVSANTGTMSYIGFDGVRREDTEAYSALLEDGKSLADYGFKMTDADVKHWADRTLEGWYLDIFDENWEWLENENAPYADRLFSTAEVIAFAMPATAEHRYYQFNAKWSGNDDDYIAWVDFDGRGAMVVVRFTEGAWTNSIHTMQLRKDGTAIGDQVDETVTGAVEGDSAWGEFEGWLACEMINDTCYMKSATVYSYAQIAKMIPEENFYFVPKWSNVALEKYEETFDVLMPVDYTAMTVDTKYDVAAETTAYFSFAAPADGIYLLCTDAHQGIDREMELSMDGWQEPFFDGYNRILEMTKGETVKFAVTATQAAKVWVEKANAVAKLELVSQDKTATYIVNESFDPMGTLSDVVLKVTFEDGTVFQGSGFEVFQKVSWDLPFEGSWEEDNGVVTVSWESGSAKVSYQIAVDKAKVIGFEVIPAADMFDVYEGTMGTEYDGIYVYEEAFNLAYVFATYKFTWSDGTVETFQLDPETMDQYYHGIYVGVDDFDPFTTPWTVGTNLLPIGYGDLTDDLPVVIKENKAKSIEILGMNITEYTLGDPEYFVKSGDGWVMDAFDYSGLKLKVTYTDGTSKILTEEENITTYRNLFDLLDNTMFNGHIDDKVHTEPGKNTVSIEFMGCIDEYDVNVVKQAVVNGNASVSDATVEEALKEAQGNVVTLDATAGNAADQTSSVKLPTESVEKLAKEEVAVVIKLDSATVTFDAAALAAIADQAGDTVTITLVVKETKSDELTEKQQAALKNKTVEAVLSALLFADGEPIGDFKGGSVKVQIPFTPESGFAYTVHYVADDGATTAMTTEKGADYIAFWTNHFSDYVVVKEKEAAKPSNPAVPNTGDSNNLMGVTVMLVVSSTAAAALWLALRKRNAT